MQAIATSSFDFNNDEAYENRIGELHNRLKCVWYMGGVHVARTQYATSTCERINHD